MKEILNYQFLNNSILSYILVIGGIILAFFLRKIISHNLSSLVFRLLKRSTIKNTYERQLKEYISQPLSRFLFWIITVAALGQLNPLRPAPTNQYSLENIFNSLLAICSIYTFIQLLIGISKFVILIWSDKLQSKGSRSAYQIISLIGRLIVVCLWIIGFLMVLNFALKWDIKPLLTNISLVTAALALAAKESLENLIASFVIFLDKPFYVGDTVVVSGVTGTVENIGLRSSRIRTSTKTLVTVPNKNMVSAVLENQSEASQRKYSDELQLALTTNQQQITSLIEAIKDLLNHSEDWQIDTLNVYLKSIGSTAHVLHYDYLISKNVAPDTTSFYKITDAINVAIIQLCNDKNISFI